MNEPQYELMQGIRATAVDGAENLLRQGEYYFANGQLIMKCPVCRFDNLAPKDLTFKTGNWLQRLLGIKKGLTLDKNLICWHCHHGVRVWQSAISTTTEPVNG